MTALSMSEKDTAITELEVALTLRIRRRSLVPLLSPSTQGQRTRVLRST